MSKKVLSVLLAVMMVFGIASVATVSAAEDSRRIYFEAPEEWQSATVCYAHIWNEKGEVAAWQTKKEKMTPVDENSKAEWYYDVPESKNGEEYNLVIFSAPSPVEKQTFDTVMLPSCFGDTAYVTDEVIENPVDSTQTAIVAAWKNNPEQGAHVTITSTGKVVGTAMVPGETSDSIIAAFVAAHGDPEDAKNYWPDLITEEKQAEYKTIIDELVPIPPTKPEPEPTEPEPTEPKPTEPGTTEPGTTEPEPTSPADPYGRKPGIPLPKGVKPVKRYADQAYKEANPDWDGYYRIYYFEADADWVAENALKSEGYEIGFYWFKGEQNIGEWPGQAAYKLELEGVDNVYYGFAPSDVPFIIWNNGIDGGLSAEHMAAARQTVNMNVEDEDMNDLGTPDLCGAIAKLTGEKVPFENPITGEEMYTYVAGWQYFDPQTGEKSSKSLLDENGEPVLDENGYPMNPYYDMDYDFIPVGTEPTVPPVNTMPPTTAGTDAPGKGGSSSNGNNNNGKGGTVDTADTAVAAVLITVLVSAMAVAYLARKRENA